MIARMREVVETSTSGGAAKEKTGTQSKAAKTAAAVRARVNLKQGTAPL
jgi:hypothetical protein